MEGNQKRKKRKGRFLGKVKKKHRCYATVIARLVRNGKILNRQELRKRFGLSDYALEVVLDYFAERYPEEYEEWRKLVLKRGPEALAQETKNKYAKMAKELIEAPPEIQKQLMKNIEYKKLEELALKYGGVYKQALDLYVDLLPPGQREILKRKLAGYTENEILSDIKSLIYLLLPIERISTIINMEPGNIRKRVEKLKGDPKVVRALKLAKKVGRSIYSRKNGIHPRVLLDLLEIIKKEQDTKPKLEERLLIEPTIHKYSDIIIAHFDDIDPEEINLSYQAKEGLEKVIQAKEKEGLVVFGIPREKAYNVIEEGLISGKSLEEIAREIANRYGVKKPTESSVSYHRDIVIRRVLAREGIPHYQRVLERVKKGEIDEGKLPIVIGLKIFRNYKEGKLHPIVQREIDKLVELAKNKKRKNKKLGN